MDDLLKVWEGKWYFKSTSYTERVSGAD